MADLIKALSDHSSRFGFFQAVSLLEEYYQKTTKDSSPLRTGRISFRPDPSIAFPSSDIASIKADENSAEIEVAFMGLIGASSPLPNYFSEYISHHPEHGEALQDFCGIFNNRMHALFYELWRKYRLASAAGTEQFMSYLCLLAGKDPNASPQELRMLAYMGTMAGGRRSAEALATVVSHSFDDVPVEVIQWMPRETPLANPTQLGKDCVLGTSAQVGTTVLDYNGKFRITVGPLKRKVFETFVGESEKIGNLRRVVHDFLTDPLEFDVEVKLEASDLIPAVLGGAIATGLGTVDSASTPVEADAIPRIGQTASLGNAKGGKGAEYSVVM